MCGACSPLLRSPSFCLRLTLAIAYLSASLAFRDFVGFPSHCSHLAALEEKKDKLLEEYILVGGPLCGRNSEIPGLPSNRFPLAPFADELLRDNGVCDSFSGVLAEEQKLVFPWSMGTDHWCAFSRFLALFLGLAARLCFLGTSVIDCFMYSKMRKSDKNQRR